MSRMTRKGQVTIPKKIRESLGLKPGSEIDFEMEDGACFLKKKVVNEPVARWVGFLRSSRTTDEMIEELRGKAE